MTNHAGMKRIVGLAMVVGALSPHGARAAVTHEISIANFSFTPSQVTANLGDSVRWNWVSGFHSVVNDATNVEICAARSAPAPSCSLDLPTSGPPFVLRYHCGIHASMTGIVTTDRPPSIAITTPRAGDIVTSPVTVSGTATDDGTIASVQISAATEPLGLLARTEAAPCTSGCGTGSIGWSASLPLLPGRYALTATVTDNNGLKTTTGPVVVVVL